MKANAFFVAIILCATFFSCNSSDKEAQKEDLVPIAEAPKVDPVKRGEHLVNSVGCHDCHTPKKFNEQGVMELDIDRLLSGHPADEALPPYDSKTAQAYVLFSGGFTAVVGPWGTSFSANLTPDDTGIGTWSDAQFINAIRNGKYKGMDGSRDLLPPMPWPSYRNFSDEDLKSIFAYLKSIKPVENIVPAPLPPAQAQQ